MEEILILFVIIFLVSLIFWELWKIERLAVEKGDYRKHGREALVMFVFLTLLVFSLEVMLRLKVVEFDIPKWLYWGHVLPAVFFYLSFVAKIPTASKKRRKAHIWLSKPVWFFWVISGFTAIAIGFWNLLI